MFCPKCGNQIDDNAAFCNKCGEKLHNMGEKEVKTTAESNVASIVKKATKKPIVLAVGAAVILLLIVLVYHIEMKPNKILKSVQEAHFSVLPDYEIGELLDSLHTNPYRNDEEPEWLISDGKYPEFHGKNKIDGSSIEIRFTGEIDDNGVAEISYIGIKYPEEKSFNKMREDAFESYLLNFSKTLS